MLNQLYKKIDYTIQKQVFLTCLIIAILFLFPIESFADYGNDAISQTLCNVIKKLTGPIGKAIATIAVVVLGIGMFLGKLAWPVAIATALGIGMIFGAANIVDWIGAGTYSINNNGTNINLVC